MENELQICPASEFEKFPKDSEDWKKRVFCIEIGDYVQIGTTNNIFKCIAQINRTAKRMDATVGNVVFSKLCTNAREIELEILHQFAHLRCGKAKTISIRLSEVSNALSQKTYLDDSERLKNEAQKTFLSLKGMLEDVQRNRK